MPLATTLDGTQTFGWSNGTALFPATPPTITMPPYTELEFPLYLKPKSEAYEDVVRAVFQSLRQPLTPLNSAFFSRANVEQLHASIQRRVAESLGLAIDKQSDWELLLIMRRTYLETANNWPEELDAEIERLNSMVLQEAVDVISKNITRYLVYRSNIPMPEPMPGPAEALTQPPFETGTPAPLPNLNADYERSLQGFMSATPAPRATESPLWVTTPPREMT